MGSRHVLAHPTFGQVGVAGLDGDGDAAMDIDDLLPDFRRVVLLHGCRQVDAVRDGVEQGGEKLVAAGHRHSVVPAYVDQRKLLEVVDAGHQARLKGLQLPHIFLTAPLGSHPRQHGLHGLESRSWDAAGAPLPPPYGAQPLGQIAFGHGRMLAALCKGDVEPSARGPRACSSYGGTYTLVDGTLEVLVDMASDPGRIGGKQVREVELTGERMLLRPPQRLYAGALERRELLWERVWRPLTPS
jgi:hypothetical protein